MKLYLRGKTWWVSYWDANAGRQIRVSTKTGDKAEAERRMLRDYASVFAAEEKDRMMAAIGTAKRSVAAKRMAAATTMRLDCCWDEYPHRGRNGRELSPNTVRVARICWDDFVRFCAENGVEHVGQLTDGIAERFIASKKPRYRQLCHIYCKTMLERVGVADNPFKAQPARRKADVTHREPLTEGETRRMLDLLDGRAARDPRLAGFHDAREYAAFIRFMIYSGLRVGDAATFRVSDMDMEKQEIYRYRTDKTHARVSFPIHKAMLARISQAVLPGMQVSWNGAGGGEPDGSGYLFPTMARNYLAKGSSPLTRRFRRVLDAAGIKGEPGQYCLHCLRTTFATICCENNVPMAVIQSWLGHESRFVTEIYARFNDMRKKRMAVAMIPDF